MTTIDMALILIYVPLCAMDYVKHLEALISGTALTHASCFHLPLETMVLSLIMLNLDLAS